MDWLKKLKMASVKKSIPGLVLFVAAAVALLFFTKCYSVFGMIAPKTLADLTPETMNGAFVEDDIYFLYTPYVEVQTYKSGERPRTTAMQYLTDFDDVYYMGLYVRSGRLDEAEEMMDACADLMDGMADWEDVPILHVKGRIRAMDEDDLGYYMEIAEGDPEWEELLLPYYLEVDYINNIPIWGSIALLAVAVLLLALGIVPMIKALRGGYQKQVREKLMESGSLEAEAEKAERFYDSAPETSGVRMDRNYVFFQNGAESILLRPWDVAWAYQSTTQHRTNGIPTGKTYAAVLRTMDGKSYTLGMKEKEVQALLTAIQTALPGVVLGYDDELEKLYKSDRNAFRRRWEEKMPELGQSIPQ